MIRLLLAFVLLGLLPAQGRAAVETRDIQSAVNLQSFLDTFAAVASRGGVSRETAEWAKDNYGKGLAALYAKYDKAGQGAEFRRRVDQTLPYHRTTLHTLFPQGGGPSRVAKAPNLPSLPQEALRVLEASDATERAAQQLATVRTWLDYFRTMNPLASDIHALDATTATWVRVYMAYETELNFAANKAYLGNREERNRYENAAVKYEASEQFRKQVLGQALTAQTVTDYFSRKTQDAERRQQIDKANAQRWKEQSDRLKGIPQPSDSAFSSLGPFLFFLLFGGGGIAVILILHNLRKRQPAHPPLSENYGKARFAPPVFDLPRPDAFSRGAFLGQSSAPQEGGVAPAGGAPVFTVPESHLILAARTRTGKFTRVLAPTLLRYSGSMLVIDPKGECSAVTGRARREQLGQTVHVLNPWHELAQHFGGLGLYPPATYNPLDVLDRNDPNAVAIAQSLAATISPTGLNDKDRFWSGQAANVISAVFLWLADHPAEKKTLARMREIVSLSRREFTEKYLVQMAASEGYSGAVREMVSQLIDMADATYSGVMSNVSEATKFISDPQLKASTATSTFAMKDLLQGSTTVYLVIPPERMETQRTWLRLVLTAAMQTFKRSRAEDRKGRGMFLIDEFPALGRMEDVPRDIATMSGYGLDFTLVIQGLDQLKAIYGEAASTILNNCAWKWFCNVSDLETAKYVSETLGQKTVRTVGQSESEGISKGGASEGKSTTYGETGRALLRPEEIIALGRDVAIAFQPEDAPLYLRPVDYWKLTEAFDRLKAKYPAMYWEPPLMYDANPYIKDSKGAGGGQEQGSGRAASRKGMTDAEAREILEIGTKATRAEILAAYRRLMTKVHPDKGGSNFFAKQLNAAKAVLLGE